jgi:beta-glucosidase
VSPVLAPSQPRRLALALALGALLASCHSTSGSGAAVDAGADAADAARARADAILAQMTIDEKIQLVHGSDICGFGKKPGERGGDGYIPGIAHLHIPALQMVGGGAGVTDCGNRGPSAWATAFPSPLGMAATWDPALSYSVGARIAREARDHGFNDLLGGAVNLSRDPRGGRTFEYFGEDPLLAGKMVAPQLRGIQDQKILATIKHFAGYQWETGRYAGNSAIIDERTLRELYLEQFEIGIAESGAGVVMCSYNEVNGVYACENAHLLGDILKGEWGFQGWVQSDWLATHSTQAAASAGLDEEEPGSTYFGGPLKTAVSRGQVPMSRLDDMVRRKLTAMIQFGLFDDPPVVQPIDFAAGGALSGQVEEEAAVLLKNAAGALPLDASSVHSITLVGAHADVAVLSGGGSAQVTPNGGNVFPDGGGVPPGPLANAVWDPSSPLDAIRARAPGATVTYLDGSDPAAAAMSAVSSDVAIVFAWQWQTEGADLTTLALPGGQDALIAQVAAANPRTVVVLETGGPVLMPWVDGVGAILEAWFPGMQGGQRIAALLFGDVNPSGKLPITFPKSEADLPSGVAPPAAGAVTYTEGLFMGYRWYDGRGIAPLFPFGYGLSYSSFSYGSVQVSPPATDGTRPIQVAFTVTNTGARAGAEVAEVYLGLPASTGEPPKRLVGWQRIQLAAGQAKPVTVALEPRRLAFWNVAKNAWDVAAGDYGVYVGASSRDVRLTSTIRVNLK